MLSMRDLKFFGTALAILSLPAVTTIFALGRADSTRPSAAEIAEFTESGEDTALLEATEMTAPHEPSYDRLFPRYAEICAVTQIKGVDGDAGGSGGHAVMYLKGVCRDKSAAYPRIKMCDPGTFDLNDPNAGTTVSVNKMFRNINWVATEGRKTMLKGDLAPGETVTEATRERTVKAVTDTGAYNGVKIHDEDLSAYVAEKESLAVYVARKSVGTDFAISMGRNAYCSKVPVDEKITLKMVDYLNSLNDQYALTDRDYHWSGITDNCTHVVHNAFAAAGFRKFKSTQGGFFRRLFNLAFPSNEFIRTAQLGNREIKGDVVSLWKDELQREFIQVYGRPMGGPGGVTTFEPMLSEGNELYVSSMRIMSLSIPLIRNRDRQIRQYSTQNRFVDLESNLLATREEITKALAELKPLEEIKRRNRKLRGADFTTFYQTYRGYLDGTLLEIDEKRERLRDLRGRIIEN